ncbi:uncharacterized protein PV07_09055 [Cladophialophora immunda]|uniref:F-box domain-containing protein n=1 Tax=Cladophialophora immunda TaxID=569365 RepID=A0A0D1ZDW8_9EURO|nr:uncharacterized protein PV07_09055 [Cladophialophora immunda]KIW25921.1 hypothetical protein PV07_09055 [Cladophialophora immunda]
MATLESLSIELISIVVQYLGCGDRGRFCQVAKWCYQLARPDFYRDVELLHHQVPTFLRIIISYPYLANLVKSIRLCDSDRTDPIAPKDLDLFRKHLVGTGPYADFFWANTIVDPNKLRGMLIETMLSKLVSLEEFFINDTIPDFVLLASPGSGFTLPPSLKTVFKGGGCQVAILPPRPRDP